MAEEDDSQKTEDPTDRKKGKAREKGEVAQSQEIKNWVTIAGALLSIIFLVPGIMQGVGRTALPFIEMPDAIPVDFANLRLVFANLAWDVFRILAPIFALFMILAIAGTVGQVGFVWAPSKLKLEASKISVLKGAKRMASTRAIVEFVKGVLKLVLTSLVAFSLALPLLKNVSLLPGMALIQSLQRLQIVAVRLLLGTLAVMTVIAVLDYFYQKYTHTKQLRMTKQEVKDETKQSEGDPQIKARIRKLRQERAQQRMMTAVPQADVVVTNPTHYAVAMEYKMEKMTAPRVVAKGIDSLALRIRAVAEEHDVPIVENPPLAQALYAAVEIDEEIPEEHYKAVAEVIGYVMRLRGKTPSTDRVRETG